MHLMFKAVNRHPSQLCDLLIFQFITWLTSKKKEVDPSEFGIGRTKIFVKSPETIWLLEEMLEQKMDPEAYKQKVQQFKESEARAKKAQGSVGLKPKCIIS